MQVSWKWNPFTLFNQKCFYFTFILGIFTGVEILDWPFFFPQTFWGSHCIIFLLPLFLVRRYLVSLIVLLSHMYFYLVNLGSLSWFSNFIMCLYLCVCLYFLESIELTGAVGLYLQQIWKTFYYCFLNILFSCAGLFLLSFWVL